MREQANVTLINRKSMKSRPGALKRREKVDQAERERFARNLAEMGGKRVERAETEDGGEAVKKQQQQPHNRWAALRGFIAQTMEKKPELNESKS